MTIRSSGALPFTEIENEFSDTAPHSLSEFYAGGSSVPSGTTDGSGNAIPSSGTIKFSDFYNTSNAFAFTISTTQADANLRTLAIAAGWNASAPVTATIASGVSLYASSTSTYGLTINGSWTNGVTLINNGTVVGKGGTGGAGHSATGFPSLSPSAQTVAQEGTAGGTGMLISVAATLDNTNGRIAGGGGGGGGAGSYAVRYNLNNVDIVNGGPGGGGVAFGDTRGTPDPTWTSGDNSQAGIPGTVDAGGAGFGMPNTGEPNNKGGDGGGYGEAGGTGDSPATPSTVGGHGVNLVYWSATGSHAGKAGGAAGAATSGYSNLTVTNAGTINGTTG